MTLEPTPPSAGPRGLRVDPPEHDPRHDPQDDVRRPGGDNGGEGAGAAQGEHEGEHDPVGKPDDDADPDALGDPAAPLGAHREGDADEGQDQAHEDEGDLALQVRFVTGGIVALPPEFPDIVPQLPETHLVRAFLHHVQVFRFFDVFDGERCKALDGGEIPAVEGRAQDIPKLPALARPHRLTGVKPRA